LSKPNEKQQKPAVLLIHGLVDSSDSWMCNKNNSIAQMLVNEGFDVWMGNYRANKYSNRHAHLDPTKDLEYWRNSVMPDLATYDIPSFIEHVRNVTNR
jgi:lysosomal acid lipase/cholesteryl ester hydrolase